MTGGAAPAAREYQSGVAGVYPVCMYPGRGWGDTYVWHQEFRPDNGLAARYVNGAMLRHVLRNRVLDYAVHYLGFPGIW